MLNNPFCRGVPGRRHVREQMRLETQAEGCVYSWRCPACHRTTDIFDREPLESRLVLRDEVAIVVPHDLFEFRLADGWYGPCLIRAKIEEGSGRTATLEVRDLQGQVVPTDEYIEAIHAT